MPVIDFLRDAKSYMSLGATRGGWLILGEINRAVLKRVGSYANFGTRCFEEDWEVFIILDSCRHDVMQEVTQTENYAFLPEEVPSRYSCASTSEEYVQKAFDEEFTGEMEDTALICGNLWPAKLREELTLDERFSEYIVAPREWRNTSQNISPEKITDTAIKYWRERPDSVNRMIVWYMQPHAPYRTWELSSNEIWDGLMSGELSRDEVWRAYYDNLLWVLDEVDDLLKNLDSDQVIVSADHGEAFGEFGCFGHPKYVPLPMLKKVPWIRTTAVDEKSREPDTTLTSSDDLSTEEINEQLKNLGYL